MNLIDLKPRWLDYKGQHVAIMFLCPHCVARLGGNRTSIDIWLTCFFMAPVSFPVVPDDYPVEALRGSRGERALFYEALRETGNYLDAADAAYTEIVDCKSSCAWQRTGDDFATMSITPSIDASACGHWHGFITNGQIT
jgi:hypothetical protein